MRLQLPKSGKGKPWTLRIVRNNPIVGDYECFGYCCAEDKEIVVSKQTQIEGVAREVLIHEMLHRLLPFMNEDAIDYLARSLDEVLDICETEAILEL